MPERDKAAKHCCIQLPDGTSCMVVVKAGLSIKEVLAGLCERHGINGAAVDLFLVGGDKVRGCPSHGGSCTWAGVVGWRVCLSCELNLPSHLSLLPGAGPQADCALPLEADPESPIAQEPVQGALGTLMLACLQRGLLWVAVSEAAPLLGGAVHPTAVGEHFRDLICPLMSVSVFFMGCKASGAASRQ